MLSGIKTPTRTNASVPMKIIGGIVVSLIVLISTFVGLSRSSQPSSNTRIAGKSMSLSNRRLGAGVPSFSVDFGEEPVAMRIAASAHYMIDTEEGAKEWAKLIPPNGHLVYLPSPSSPSSSNNSTLKPYTPTLFHQLACLDIIRRQYLLPAPPVAPISKETEHCMNYLRETVLCRSNLWLESAKNVVGTASRAYDAVCRDWGKVYEAAARNRREVEEREREIGDARSSARR